MEISQFLKLKLGSFIYHSRDLDIRRTASQFLEERHDQYAATNAVMWTRPAFGDGFGRDIELSEAWQWEPLPINVWETHNQELINKFVVLQQQEILNQLSAMRFNLGRV